MGFENKGQKERNGNIRGVKFWSPPPMTLWYIGVYTMKKFKKNQHIMQKNSVKMPKERNNSSPLTRT